MTYDAADNSAKSYALAIETMREKLNSFRREQIGDCTLYLGDCREILPLLPKVDAVVTDPPYGIGLDYGTFQDAPSDVAALVRDVIPAAINLASRVAVTSGVPNIWNYPKADWVLNWTDPSGEGGCVWGFPSWQPILVYGRDPFLATGRGRRSDTVVKRFLRDESAHGHPCPKPLGAMLWIVERVTMARETILDPFMGSGTTGVACVKLGRKFIGIEIEPKYFEIACRRIREAYAQPDMFIEAAKPSPAEQLSLLGEAAE
jgi:DNA modification methylase